MPKGDCARAHVHHSPGGLSPALRTAGVLSRIEANHSSVAWLVVCTSRLGPAAKQSGIRAVATVARKRNGAVGRRAPEALCDMSVISAMCEQLPRQLRGRGACLEFLSARVAGYVLSRHGPLRV